MVFEKFPPRPVLSLDELHRAFLPAQVRHGTYDRASGAEQVRALLERPTPPAALFICSDHMAIGGYEAIAGAGLRVPEDVSVVGFDDLPEARWVAPALPTVRQPLREMGGSAPAHPRPADERRGVGEPARRAGDHPGRPEQRRAPLPTRPSPDAALA